MSSTVAQQPARHVTRIEYRTILQSTRHAVKRFSHRAGG